MPMHDPLPPRRRAPEPVATAYAWTRYRRIMRWMTLLSAACAAAAIVWLRWSGVPMRLHLAIATTLGVFLTILVGTGLMSLVFLSAGSGHDTRAGERFDP